jgi:hypothetical protein
LPYSLGLAKLNIFKKTAFSQMTHLPSNSQKQTNSAHEHYHFSKKGTRANNGSIIGPKLEMGACAPNRQIIQMVPSAAKPPF